MVDFSISVQKMKNWVGRTVDGPPMCPGPRTRRFGARISNFVTIEIGSYASAKSPHN